jgi:hypothetical protein
VYDVLRRRIVVSIPGVAKEALVTWPTAKTALERLGELGIATESTGRRRDRLYTYKRQLAILAAGRHDMASQPSASSQFSWPIHSP